MTTAAPVLPVPEVHETRLGGVSVWAVHKPAVPLLRAAVRFNGPPGPATAVVREGGPAGRPVSWAAATLLDRGSLRSDLSELAADVEVLPDATGATLCMTVAMEDGNRLLQLVEGLLSKPAGDVDSAGATARMNALTAVEATQPGGTARRAVLAVLYGAGHPLAEPLPDLADLDGAAWWSAAEPVAVTLVGAADPAGLIRRLGGEAGPALGRASDIPRTGAGWVAVPRPGSEQSAIRVVVPLPPPGAEDRAAAELLNQLVGGGRWTSRLRTELREKRGWGYHPVSLIVDHPGCAHLELEADVATEVTVEATAVVRGVLSSLAEPVPDDELETARQGLLGELRSDLDTQSGTTRLLIARAAAGLAAEELGRHAAAICQVAAADVTDLARRVLADDLVAGAVAGEPAAVEAAVRS